jgi:hypothetical protein
MNNQSQPMLRNTFDDILRESSGIVLTEDSNPVQTCPYCREEIRIDAIKCRYCHSSLQSSPADAKASDVVAFFLAVFFGVVGLWYKGHWGAGFAWIVGAILFFIMTGGVGLIAIPFFWIAIIIHAAAADDRQ